jgi:hypothetical protein
MVRLARLWALGASLITFSGGATLLLGGCSDYYSLGLQGPVPPMAVGATAVYRLQYALTWDCKPDRFTRCSTGNPNAITQTTEVTVDDPALLQATLQSDGQIVVRALAAGDTTLRANGIDAHGKPQSVSRKFYLLTPEEAVLSTDDLCGSAPLGSARTVLTNQVLPLAVSVRNGTTQLHAEGLPISLDRGGLLPAPSGKPFDVLAPAAPTVTTVKTLLAKPFSLTVRVYQSSDIDGIALRPTAPGPYRQSEIYILGLDLLVAGDRVCQLPDPGTTRTVQVLTPDLCLLRSTSSLTASSEPPFAQQEGGSLTAVYLHALKPGTCQIQLSLKGTSVSSMFSLPIVAS